MQEVELVHNELGKNYCNLGVLKEKSTSAPNRTFSTSEYFSAFDGEKLVRISSNSYEKMDLIQAITSGEIRPIFHLTNFNCTNISWYSFYPNLSSLSIVAIKSAASLHEEMVENKVSLERAVTNLLEKVSPDDDDIDETRRRQFLNELREEIELKIDLPWEKNLYYREVGERIRLTGAIIDLSWKKDAAGNEIIDFQDIFVALYDVMDFMRCPDPEMILNNCGVGHMKREDENSMTGIFGNVQMKVQRNIVLKQIRDDDPTKEIRIIVDALKKHQICRDCDIKRVETATIYYESTMNVDFTSVYVTSILNPTTHCKHFYINELGRTMIQISNDVMYYSPSPDKSTHIYMEKLVPNVPVQQEFKLYMVSVDIEIQQFKSDFKNLLKSMYRAYPMIESVSAVLRSVDRKPIKVVPPEAGTYTKQFRYKSRKSIKPVPDSCKPIFIPPFYVDDFKKALFVAQRCAFAVTKNHANVFVSSKHEIVEWREGIEMDSFSAFYISAHGEQPVIFEFSGDGDTVIPASTSSLNHVRTRVNNPHINQFPFDACLRSENKSSRNDVLSTLNRLFKKNITPDQVRKFIFMAKPELFDHSIEEMYATLADIDPKIHFRILERLYDCNIMCFVNADNPKSKIEKDFSVEVELPRSSALVLRDMSKYSSSLICLFKYYEGCWKYTPILKINPVGQYIFKDVDRLAILATYYGDTALFDPFSTSRLTGVIDTSFNELDIVSQTVNMDGYCTSITLHKPLSEIMNYLGVDKKFSDESPIDLTITFIGPKIPCEAPISDTHHALPTRFVGELEGINFEIKEFSEREIALVFQDDCYISITENAEISTNHETMRYQKKMAVLVSLMQFFALFIVNSNSHDPIFEGDDGNLELKTVILDEIEQVLLERSKERISDPNVAIAYRFLPEFVDDSQKVLSPTQFKCSTFSFDALTRAYMRNFMHLESAHIAGLLSFIELEIDFMLKKRIPLESMRYIAGIHSIVPYENIYDETILPAFRGERTIIRSWKEYEYAYTRFAAKKNMSSWIPLVDLTDCTTALEHENKTAFVKRMPNGAIIYGYAISTVEDAKQIFKAKNALLDDPDYQPAHIKCQKDLEKYQFNCDTLLTFRTSSSEALGSLYALIVFGPA